MSVTGISTERGGGAGISTSTFFECGTTACSPIPTPLPISTKSTSTQLSFTATLTLPFPPPGSTTLISLVTLSPTSITTIKTATTFTNIISTTTATTLSITALPNPAATAALAAESSLVVQNTHLARTNLTVSAVLGGVTFVLLLLLLLLLLICFRRRTSKSDTESPPFTSLAPRPAPNFAPPMSPAPQIPLPEHMRETNLSMGPRGGTADLYSRAMAMGQGRGSPSSPSQRDQAAFQFEFPYPSGGGGGLGVPTASGSTAQALASNPVSPPTRDRLMRSSSAPTSAPEPAPSIPAFRLPRISLFPATPSHESIYNTARPGTSGGFSSNSTVRPGNSSETFGAPLRRQRSAPMYHRALTEQVVQEREESASREARRLGRPVVSVVGERVSFGSEISSEVSFGSEDEEKRDEAGAGAEAEAAVSGSGQGTGERGRVLHSTRASSGVFPDRRDEDDDDGSGEGETHS